MELSFYPPLTLFPSEEFCLFLTLADVFSLLPSLPDMFSDGGSKANIPWLNTPLNPQPGFSKRNWHCNIPNILLQNRTGEYARTQCFEARRLSVSWHNPKTVLFRCSVKKIILIILPMLLIYSAHYLFISGIASYCSLRAISAS